MNTLAFGPMSPEIIEAIFRYSHIRHKPFMLIASKNQIDYNGGYVGNWNTSQYMNYIKQMRQTYLDSDVLICRDHCGPGFNGSDLLSDTFSTISEDIRCGFDLIHIDFCHYIGPRQKGLEKAAEAIKFAKIRNPRIRFEIGTDEIRQPLSLAQTRRDIDFFMQVCNPEYFVVNTGSHILEDKQVGVFNAEATRQAKSLLNGYGLKLKEHNADYLKPEQIQQRRGVVDAMNIAPELGLRQTEKTLQLAQQYKINAIPFLSAAYKSKKWKKWLEFTSPDDTGPCSIFAGHYVFAGKEYQRLCKQLSDHINIKEELINHTINIIDRYVNNF